VSKENDKSNSAIMDFYSTEDDLVRCGLIQLNIMEFDSDAETASLHLPCIANEYVEQLCPMCLHDNFNRDLSVDVSHGQYFWPAFLIAGTTKSPRISVEIFKCSLQQDSQVDHALFLFLLAYGVTGKAIDEDTILSVLSETDWDAATAEQWRRLRFLLQAVRFRHTSWERWLSFAAVQCTDEDSLEEYCLMLENFVGKIMWPEDAKEIAFSDNRVIQISLNLSRVPTARRTEVIERQPSFIRSTLYHVYTLGE